MKIKFIIVKFCEIMIFVLIPFMMVGCYGKPKVEGLRRKTFDDNLQMAMHGNADAQYKLALYYEKGEGVGKDYAEAVKWYTKAAKQGNELAQLNLGECYEKGYGVDKNGVEAVKWYCKAAEQGNTQAQSRLGNIYYYGSNGVSRDFEEAIKWYSKISDEEKGYTYERKNLGDCYYFRDTPTDIEEAIKCYKKIDDEEKLLDCYITLGDIYYNDENELKDYEKAAKWYKEAVEQAMSLAEFYQEKYEECESKDE